MSPAPPAPPKRVSYRRVYAVAGLGWVSLVAILILRFVVFDLFRIPSGAMRPGLGPSSHIVTSRLARTPARGDVIVFQYPEHPTQDFVSRVIAKDGDTLAVADGHPSINGWVVPSCVVGAYSYDDEGTPHAGKLFVEFLGVHAYLIFLDSAGGFQADGPFHSKAGEYWVLGDNRFNSHDSRMWFGGEGGGVPQDLVRGTVLGGDRIGLPKGAESLQSALNDCLSKRPDQIDPPPRARQNTDFDRL